MKYQLYEVGGAVRDSILGLKSKDIDYSVVITSEFNNNLTASLAFSWFKDEIEREGFQIFLVTKEVYTIRAKFPKNHIYAGLVADFVLARYEEGFEEGTRRPKICRVGTLEDDLKRRDFTINAIARDIDGNLIDPFNGIEAIENKVLMCPVDAQTSFNDDPLRILRALRFSVTKNFRIHFELTDAIETFNAVRFIETVSTERIREELDKMFRFNTKKTIEILWKLELMNRPLFHCIFNQIWLKPTNEKR
jgi:tRNA nucleotidyltransferase/poly(A) polymerase